MPSDRPHLRAELREQRRAIPVPLRMSAADALAERLLALPFAPASGHAAGYWAMDGEIPLHSWQLRLPPGVTYCLPVLHDQVLRFAPWRAGQPLVTNRYGIPEPDVDPAQAMAAEAMTLVVMPLVGFDDQCNRLGMGGGWYDRSFAHRRIAAAPPWLVGAGFAVQHLDHITPQEWDVRADAVCTEVDTLLAAAA